MDSKAPTIRTGGKGSKTPLLSSPLTSPSSHPIQLTPSTPLSPEHLPATVSLYAPVFRHDPVITYMLCSMPDQAARLAYLPDYFRALLKAAALNSASFDAIVGDPSSAGGGGDYEACAVLMPPGKRVDNAWTLLPAGFVGCLWRLGWGGCKRMLLEYEPQTAKARSLALAPHEKYFYVFFVGTREDCRGRGLASALIKHHQSIATKAHLPVWLEATTAKSRDIYLKLGFEVVEKIVLGKGRVGSNGLLMTEGEEEEAVGVRVWGMVWRPEGYKRER